MSRQSFIRASILLTLLGMVMQVVWAISMPAFRGPDEPHHVNSIMRLADGGGWPEPGNAIMDPATHVAGRQAGLVRLHNAPFTTDYRTTLYKPRVAGFPYAEIGITPHEERSSLAPIATADSETVEIDQMTQHPPLHYMGGALVVDVLGLADAPWDRTVLLLRLYSIALTLPLIPATIYTARRLGASRRWSLAAGFLPLAIPQIFGITSVVTNDALAIGTGALTMAALAKAGTERISAKTVLLVGGSLGLALWSKGLLLALGLPLILVFMLAKNETWRTRITATLAAGTMALAVGWWWIHNIVRYGVLQPAGFSRPVPEGWSEADANFMDYGVHAFRTFTRSFFSSFGWLEVDFPTAITMILLALFIAGTVWAVIRAGRARTTFLILLSPFIGLLILLYGQGWLNYVSTAAVAGVQGRYLYPTIAAFGGIVLGLRTFGPLGYRIFGIGAVVINVFGLTWLLRHVYPGGAFIDLDRFAHAAGLPSAVIIASLVGYLAIGAFLVLMVLRLSRGTELKTDATAPHDDHEVDTGEVVSRSDEEPADNGQDRTGRA